MPKDNNRGFVNLEVSLERLNNWSKIPQLMSDRNQLFLEKKTALSSQDKVSVSV